MKKKVTCPYCGYQMPIEYEETRAKAKGLFVRCKGRGCKKKFEIKIN